MGQLYYFHAPRNTTTPLVYRSLFRLPLLRIPNTATTAKSGWTNSPNTTTARFYDPASGRWGCVDPLAEKYMAWSGYNYVMNNPVNMIDPDGRSVNSTHTDADGNVIAVYDDGDLGVYKHDDIEAGTHIRRSESLYRPTTGSNRYNWWRR